MAEATEIRLNEKKKNKATIKDAAAAQVAVAQATTVLKEFYAKAGQATSFVQQEPPASFTEPYTGMGGENGGIVGMLEVIEADFARLEATTSTAEDEAQREYDTFMHDSKVNKAGKVTDIEHKTARRRNLGSLSARRPTWRALRRSWMPHSTTSRSSNRPASEAVRASRIAHNPARRKSSRCRRPCAS